VDPEAARIREEITAGTFLQPGFETTGDGGIVVGRTPGGAGYLGLTRLVGFDDTTDEGIEVLAAAIDELVAGLGEAPGLVIDVRGNRGGLEVFAPVVASRFLDTQRIVARRTARVAGTDDFVPSGEVTVTPMPTGTYQGPVVVLIDPATAGAAELLVLALRSQEGVTLIGEATAGSLSPIFPRGLPNNWIIGLSNQRVYDADDVLWEVAGIPPDEVVPLTIADLDAGRDPVLEHADRLLSG
jgi:C-terminal processing protease CtpA/Prc